MDYTCRCGAFAAAIDPSKGVRAVCYCKFCREFTVKTDAADTLDAAGGTDLFQVAPEEMRIMRGADKLAWTRFTPKGPIRWFTTCCNSPIANTLATRAIPFVTLNTPRLVPQDAVPPIKVRVHRKFATKRVPDDSHGVGYLMRNFGRRALKSRLNGGWKRNPFFDAYGKLISDGPSELK